MGEHAKQPKGTKAGEAAPERDLVDELTPEVASLLQVTPMTTEALADLAARYPQEKDLLVAWVQANLGNNAAAIMIAEVARLNGRPFDHVGGKVDTEMLALTGNRSARDPRAPSPADRLPFVTGGWDAVTINTRLGQHDRLGLTDSDGTRCTQATLLAAHVFRGPSATVTWLKAAGTEAYHRALTPELEEKYDAAQEQVVEARRTAAAAVLVEVCAAIEAGTATYGDLSWAQEALHDMTMTDFGGTPSARYNLSGKTDVFTPMKDVYCTTTKEVLAEADKLAEGEQLLCARLTYVFNAAFAADEKANPDLDPTDTLWLESGVTVHREKMPRKGKPSPAEFESARDRKAGHQLMIARQGGSLYLYDAEVQAKGGHLRGVSGKDASAIAAHLVDEPARDTYQYIQIEGKLAPAATKPRP